MRKRYTAAPRLLGKHFGDCELPHRKPALVPLKARAKPLVMGERQRRFGANSRGLYACAARKG